MIAFHALALAGFGPFIEFDAEIFGGGMVGHFIYCIRKIIRRDVERRVSSAGILPAGFVLG